MLDMVKAESKPPKRVYVGWSGGGYYGGFVSGAAALYSAVKLDERLPVTSIYTLDDLPDYQSFESNDCPYCKQGIPLDALVNSHGYSKL